MNSPPVYMRSALMPDPSTLPSVTNTLVPLTLTWLEYKLDYPGHLVLDPWLSVIEQVDFSGDQRSYILGRIIQAGDDRQLCWVRTSPLRHPPYDLRRAKTVDDIVLALGRHLTDLTRLDPEARHAVRSVILGEVAELDCRWRDAIRSAGSTPLSGISR